MKPGLKVLDPGLHTTVQDLGRFGYQAQGVPVSGALDSLSVRLANALVGNPAKTPVLEALGSGPALEVAATAIRVAVAGASASLVTDDGKRVIPAWQSVRLARGAVVRIVLGRESACAYLATEGGIAVAPVLGSASTYVRARLGGFQGRALRRGDLVPVPTEQAAECEERRLPSPPAAAGDQPIRIVLGPQQERFTKAAVAALLNAEFRVSNNADRMGMRLDGPMLRHRGGWDIVSDAIATGAIQVPGSGQPILLLADHQTTGGYPKIATIVSADLSVVGRRRPGDAIRFRAIGIAEAERLARDEEHRCAALIASIAPVCDGGIDLASLYAGNLISGVVTATE